MAVENAAGIRPTAAEKAVIKTARIRWLAAWNMASWGVRPLLLSSLKAVIRMMPFMTEMPSMLLHDPATHRPVQNAFRRHFIELVRSDVLDRCVANEGKTRFKLLEFKKAISAMRLHHFQNAVMIGLEIPIADPTGLAHHAASLAQLFFEGFPIIDADLQFVQGCRLPRKASSFDILFRAMCYLG